MFPLTVGNGGEGTLLTFSQCKQGGAQVKKRAAATRDESVRQTSSDGTPDRLPGWCYISMQRAEGQGTAEATDFLAN